MTSHQLHLIRGALELLHQLAPRDDPATIQRPRRLSPVAKFARHYLKRDPDQNITCAELWLFYQEIARSGELAMLTRSEFLRALPAAMEETFQAKKSHNIVRRRKRQRVQGCDDST